MNKLRFVSALLIAAILLVPGCAPISDNCSKPDVFCVGLVTDVGRRDDHAYNQAAWEGIQQSQIDGVADWIASIETVDARDFEKNLEVFAKAGYDVIVSVGDAMGDATRTVAKAYPDSYFIGVDQDQSASQDLSSNLSGLIFAEDKIGYLAGALAALMSKTGEIGAVCASDELPVMKRYGDGFLAGATYIDPEVKATVVYHNEVGLDKTFVDPEWGAAQAISLVDSGTDIIFGVGGTTGNNAIVTAVTRGAYGIGADIDQYYNLPVAAPRLLTSVLKMIAPGVVDLLHAAREAQAQTGTFPAGNYYGQVGLAPYHDLVESIPDAVKMRMAELSPPSIPEETPTEISSPYP